MTDPFVPMLAHPHKTIHADVKQALDTLISQGKCLFDLKWDGVRCIAYVDKGSVRLINRRMVDITFRYPEIVAALSAAYPDVYRVLDGEIICLGDNGYPEFARIHRRDAQQSAASAARLVAELPATFMGFDILQLDGDDVRQMPYAGRQALLHREVSGRFEDFEPILDLSATWDDGNEAWDFVNKHRLEGLIAKQKTSQYQPGRSHAWVKLKPTSSVSCLVTGYEPGEKGGALEHTMGALHIAVLDSAGEIRSVGKVGTGFKVTERHRIKALLDSGQSLIVEVEYQEVSPAGQLRFPSYKGERTDVELLDCTEDQLGTTRVILTPH